MNQTITEQDYENAAKLIGCDVPSIEAVAEVESSGNGFLTDGKPRLLFEGHQFYRYTKGAFAQSNPTLCFAKWTKEFYCKGDAETRGAGEFSRLAEARKLDEKAALMSCSIGKFQIMGFNFALCGFKSVEDFWATLSLNEGEQLKAFCAYVKAVGIDDELRNHDWAEFARRYNGPEYQKNQYDTKLANAHKKFSALATPASRGLQSRASVSRSAKKPRAKTRKRKSSKAKK